MGAYCRARQDSKWTSLVLGFNNGRLLSAVVPSRTANPKNVQLHDSLESARATGFRPCRRCNPDGPSIECDNAALVAKACRIIEGSEEELSLEELADAISRSPGYFHRLFKATTGLTPKEHTAADRAKKVREGLASGPQHKQVRR